MYLRNAEVAGPGRTVLRDGLLRTTTDSNTMNLNSTAVAPNVKQHPGIAHCPVPVSLAPLEARLYLTQTSQRSSSRAVHATGQSLVEVQQLRFARIATQTAEN